ncbi:MAG: MFS transporter [Gammaproteobacteria bacterium]
MMPLVRFFLEQPRLLSFGLLLTLFSSFGQTFLIAIFVPQLLETFALTTHDFGLLYALATLSSAATLPWFGRLIDRISLHRFSLAAAGGLAAACMAMALAPNTFGLFVAIVSLRLTGQGLLSLTASTTMARAFERTRGKALSIAGLGYPLGEAVFPIVVVTSLQLLGWRLSWVAFATLVLGLLLPALAGLLRGIDARPQAAVTPDRQPVRPVLFRDPRFYALMPGTLFLPLVLTALFLYQLPLAAYQGWSTKVIATAFIGFAAARIVASLLMGPLIDRFSARRLFPLILLPVCLGLGVLSVAQSTWVAYFYLAMAGISQGLAAPLVTSLWAEVYGVSALGAIKGVVSTCAIFATALGPLLLGWALSAGVDFGFILPACALAALLVSALSLAAHRAM